MQSQAATPMSRQDKQSVHAAPERTLTASAIIDHIDFGVLKSTDTAKLSQVRIMHKNLYNFNTQVPFPSGCLDKRLGVSNKKDQCETCGKLLADCVGHFGHLILELPVFHIGFFKDIVRILQAICKSCSRVLVEDGKKKDDFVAGIAMATNKNQYFKKVILEFIKKCKICPHCHAPNGTVRKLASAFRLVHDLKGRDAIKEQKERIQTQLDYALHSEVKGLKENLNKVTDDLNPLRVLELFRKIPQTDYVLLNLQTSSARPQDMIITQLAIPPVCIRPSVQMGFSGSNEDDLTIQLGNICHANNTIRSLFNKGHPTNYVVENWDFLQTQVALYFNSDLPGFPRTAAAKPIRALTQRLKGKMGRFRGNLSGKRVDFSARTVISPDPNLRINQVGVPVRVARVLTYPERVTVHNIKRLRQAVLNGCHKHPGANFVEYTKSNARFYLRYCDRSIVSSRLDVGDIVERHMIDGDVVLFNRQPSLHRMSIMSHRAKILQGRTFRFNECVCAPYNADFDGDEMNLHLPQTEEARAEAALLMAVQENMVSPRHGTPLITATQDFLSAAYLLTNKNNFYSKSQFCAIVTYMNDALVEIKLPPPCIYKPVMLWTGKQIITVLLRSDAPNPANKNATVPETDESKWPKLNIAVEAGNYDKKLNEPGMDRCMNKKDAYVVVRNSRLLCGNLCKKSLGGGRNGILFNLIRDYSPKLATTALNKLAKLSARWLTNRGFSIGINDVTPTMLLQQNKQDLILKNYKDVDDNIEKYKKGELETQPGADVDATLEGLLLKALNDIRGKAGSQCLEQLDYHTNSPLIMAVCGSKGSKINIAQMVACVGQQVVGGKRIQNGFHNRTLPHFKLNARGPEAKGFVASSFYTGLNANEFFFHTMGGREGLVDTAVKTAETGYMQRRLVKALEDLCLQYDGTVRTSDNTIVQFRYGDDGLSPLSVSSGLKPVNFYHVWRHTMATTSHDSCEGKCSLLFPTSMKEIIDTEEVRIRAAVEREQQLAEERALRRFTKVLDNEDGMEMDSDDEDTKEEKVLDSKLVFVNSLFDFLRGQLQERTDLLKELFDAVPSVSHARNYYNMSQKLCAKELYAFIAECMKRHERAEVEPGTAVGALAAQSIGEPGTQMTLKTFHFAGVASMNITLGVPRLKEIMNASLNIASPIITAELDTNDDLISARVVKGRIETTKLGDITDYIQIHVSSNCCCVFVKLHLGTIEKLQLSADVDTVMNAIVAHRPLKLKEKNIARLSDDEIQIFPPRNNIATNSTAKRPILFELEFIRNLLPNVVVSGIQGVGRAVISDNGSEKYKLLIEGENLMEVMATTGVVGTKTTCNHVMAVNKVLGIEAARQTIINEIKTTMDGHGLTVDPRHVSLLADLMSYTGSILGITRFGIAKMKTSVLMLASFEQTADHLFDAALRGKKEHLRGVSETIITGKPIPIGTGNFECYADVTMHQAKVREHLQIDKFSDLAADDMFSPKDLLLY